VAGGLPAAEITFRTAAAEEAIRAVVHEVPEMLVGAVTCDQMDKALEAGAKFIVSPGFNPDMVRYACSRGALMIPGTAAPGEMEQAMALGLEAVKFFLAEQNGGVAKLRAIAGPYRNLMWMPTGGINAKNLTEYLSFDQILACGGTWMVKKDIIEAENWDEVTRLSREAVRTMLGFSLGHVGINCGSETESEQTAKALCALFGFSYRPGNASNFAGDAVECMKRPFRGTNGHISVDTYSVDRAIYHLSLKGAKFDETTRRVDGTGKTAEIYLQNEYGGFVIQLTKK
jgi:2-dehydro-3-deoxyphosphogluconate aldolase/(4S)-4-hydroxy-2-oxoglutarate aldolase